MNVGRSIFFFIAMLLIVVCVVALAAEKQIVTTWDELRGVADPCEWQSVGTGAGDIAAAAGWKDGLLQLRFFKPDGELVKEQRVSMPDEVAGGTVSRIMPVRDGVSFLGIYSVNAEKLYLYRVMEDGEAERLLAVDCDGRSFAERTAHKKFSEFLFENEALTFAVWTDNELECYLCRVDGGVERTGTENCAGEDVLSIVANNQDDTMIEGGNGVLFINGKSKSSLVDGQSVTHLTPGTGGAVYYIDAVQPGLCFVDALFSASHRLLPLNLEWNGVQRTMTSAAVTREGDVIMLLDNMILTRTDSIGTQELTGVLHPTAGALRWNLIKYALLALAVAILLWLLLCGLKHGYASLVVLRGSLFVAVAAMLLVATRYFILIPSKESSELRENESVASGLLSALSAEDRMYDTRLAGEIAVMLEQTDAERGNNVHALMAQKINGQWRFADGRSAATEDGFSPAMADEALRQGQISALKNGTFQYARGTDGRAVLLLRMEDTGRPEEQFLFLFLLGSMVLLALVMLLIQLSLRVDLRRISGYLEKVSRGELPEPLKMNTGDELESLASVVNSLGDALRRQGERRTEVENSYRRFVPENVLALLGKSSVQEVDKSTFATRRMAVMMVDFYFPLSLYMDVNNNRLLFDSVNEVIERAAAIVARKGGSVFHFSYHGFDVVMSENGEAVSTAVAIQQEVLSFNEQRKLDGLPCVSLRIALDKSDVMLGIVGDTSKMEPTMISASLSTVQVLSWLCQSLSAGILCTESVIFEQKDYGNRYMGKCNIGKQPVRVYEVFDGDEFNVRRGKAASLGEFSKGVFDLYAGEAAKAKHTFLQLAHKYPMDGGARYYLYLADRIEHDPTQSCLLNTDQYGINEV